MAYKLIGQDCLAQITLRGPQDGTPAALGTPTLFPMSLVRSIEINMSASTADLSGLGDVYEVMQVTRVGREVTIEVFVPSTGPQFTAAMRCYIQVDLKSHPTDATFESYDGVVTNYTRSYPDGAQTEKITIRGAANGL